MKTRNEETETNKETGWRRRRWALRPRAAISIREDKEEDEKWMTKWLKNTEEKEENVETRKSRLENWTRIMKDKKKMMMHII